MSGRPRLRLHVTAAAENAVRRGHPWVFADRVRAQNRPGAMGELAVLYDRRDRFLALGLYDPSSPLRVRILHSGDPIELNASWWAGRLEAALGRRAGLFGPDTTAWRWIHGESDGWPGLVLDRYADVLVLKLYTAAWFPRLDDLAALLLDRLKPRSIILRLSRNTAPDSSREPGPCDGSLLAGEALTSPVLFLENGLRFEAEVVRGQKTGFFLDQRENRARVGKLARDADVLNAFSFSGGFSLYAARGGARRVTDLDLSAHALASARRNFDLNRDLPQVAAVLHETVQADTFAWLAHPPERRFDLIILDPPSLARRESERAGALAAYAHLAALAAGCLRSGASLVAASCSAHVPAGAFFTAVRDGVRRAGRAFEEILTTGQPPDHPATFPEAHYLKAVYLRVTESTAARRRSSARD